MKRKNKPSDFLKYPSISDINIFKDGLNQEGYLFEKMDGSLSQVRNIDFQVKGGSRANYLTGEKSKSSWFPNFLKWMYLNDSLVHLPEEVVMYGEWLEPITVDYPEEYKNKFYFIDLGFIGNGNPKFFDYDEARDYLKTWGIEGVEILDPVAKGIFDQETVQKLIMNTPSKLGGGDIEGFVFKNYQMQEFVKILHPKYAEIRNEQKGMDGYVTQARVLKAERRLSDTQDISKPSLEQIVMEVVSDIQRDLGISLSDKAVKGIIRLKRLI